MAWSETSGTPLGGNIYPMGKFPTHHAIFGRGGYKTVANESERLAIPIDRLTVGSIVRQHDTGVEWVVTALPQGTIDSDTHTGKDCEWDQIKKGELDLEELNSLKGKPNGLASLNSDGLVPDDQIKQIIFRGKLISDTVFQHPTIEDKIFPQLDNAIYIDQDGKMYTWTNGKYITKDGIYWQEVK